MKSWALSMRWWLALTFAGIAALTALSVAQFFSARSEAAIRERARELVAGSAVTAALEISTAGAAHIRSTAVELGADRELALFVFDGDGTLLTDERARGVRVSALPNFVGLRETALGGRRVVETIDDGRLITVALPLQRDPAAALIAVAARPDLEEAVGIVQDEIVRAALWAVAIGAAVGLAVALLITRRLRRIATAAAEIEQGHFDRELQPRFHDELGALAETIDGMRMHLRSSFERIGGERDRLHVLLEQLEEGVVAVDADLAIEFSNSRARHLLGEDLAPGERLPNPWSTVSLPDVVEALFAPGAKARTTRVHPDGDRTFVVTLLPPSTALQAAVIVLTDVTERERRDQAEREFVANAAHELRTPIAAIASAVEVLQLGAKERRADRDRFLAVVERQTARLTSLVHALLALARAQTRSEPMRLEPVAVAPLVLEVADSAMDEVAAVHICCEDVQALAHPDLLHQAVESLTANAVKHAAGSGVTLRVAHRGDERVRIEVVDGGAGMTPADAERAVDRFYRAADSDGDGFGLGLSIVREVVDAMDGTLSIDSRRGEGTTVSIELASAGPARLCE